MTVRRGSANPMREVRAARVGCVVASTAFACAFHTVRATVARAQIYELTAGASTIHEGAGAMVQFWRPDASGWISAGTAGPPSGYLKTRYRSLGVELGDIAHGSLLATDLFAASIRTAVRGTRITGSTGQLRWQALAGATLHDRSIPMHRTASPGPAVGIVELELPVSGVLDYSSFNVIGKRQTSLHSFEWRPEAGNAYGLTAGLASNRPHGSLSLSLTRRVLSVRASWVRSPATFASELSPGLDVAFFDRENLAVEYRPHSRLRLAGGRQNYLLPTGPGSLEAHSTLSHGMIRYRFDRSHVGASVYRATAGGLRSSGIALTAGRSAGRRLDAELAFFRSSPARGDATTSWQATLRQKLSPRLELLELVQTSAGNWSASFGGSVWTNPVRASVQYQTLFVPVATGNAFRQALLLSIRIQSASGISIDVGSQVRPDAEVRYTVRASTFLFGAGGRRSAPTGIAIPANMIRGHVIDESGQSREGAALRIGDDVVYTDSRGRFFLRTSDSAPQPFVVLVDEFLVRGSFDVVTAPTVVVPARPERADDIVVVLRRLERRS